jgi:hypothetical protein
MHTLHCRHLFNGNRIFQRRYMPCLQRWHLFGSRILFLLESLRSWDIHQWDASLLTLPFRHVLFFCWCVSSLQLQGVPSGLLLLVIVATELLHCVQHWLIQRHRRGYQLSDLSPWDVWPL